MVQSDYNLDVFQALALVNLLDEKLKRPDFASFRKLGVDFSGYRGSFGIQHSGCTKVDCITTIVGYLCGRALGPDPDNVAEWLDENAPGWQDSIGFKKQNMLLIPTPMTQEEIENSNIVIGPREPLNFDCKVCGNCNKAMTAKQYWNHSCGDSKPYDGCGR